MRWWYSPFAVVAIVVADLLILGAAWYLMNRPAPPPSSVGVPAPSTGSASASGTASAGAGEEIRAPLFFAVSADGAVTRATRGSCIADTSGPAVLWSAARPADKIVKREVPDLLEVLGLLRRNAREVALVGAVADCKVVGFSSKDGGKTWRRGAIPKDVWYVQPDRGSSSVMHNGRGQPLGCQPSIISGQRDGSAVAICRDMVVTVPAKGRNISTVSLPNSSAATIHGGALLVLVTSNCATLREANGKAVRAGCWGPQGAGIGLASTGSRLFAQVGRSVIAGTPTGKPRVLQAD